MGKNAKFGGIKQMIIKARKKPVVIETIQLKKNDESIKQCLMFCKSIND